MKTDHAAFSGLMAIIVTVVVTAAVAGGRFDIWDSLVGLFLCSILWWARMRPSDEALRLPFALAWGFAVVFVLGVFIDLAVNALVDHWSFAGNTDGPLGARELTHAGAWILASASAWIRIGRAPSPE